MDTGGFEPPASALRKQRSSADLRAHRAAGRWGGHKGSRRELDVQAGAATGGDLRLGGAASPVGRAGLGSDSAPPEGGRGPDAEVDREVGRALAGNRSRWSGSYRNSSTKRPQLMMFWTNSSAGAVVNSTREFSSS